MVTCSRAFCNSIIYAKELCEKHYNLQPERLIKIRESQTKWRTINKERHNAYNKQWKEDNKERMGYLLRRHSYKINYGISIEEYEYMLNQQNNVCYICGNPEKARNKCKKSQKNG